MQIYVIAFHPAIYFIPDKVLLLLNSTRYVEDIYPWLKGQKFTIEHSDRDQGTYVKILQ